MLLIRRRILLTCFYIALLAIGIQYFTQPVAAAASAAFPFEQAEPILSDEPPPMDFQPPRDANSIDDFIPPNAQLTRFEPTIDQEITTPLHTNSGDVLAFRGDRFATIIERDTFPEQSALRFKLRVLQQPPTSTLSTIDGAVLGAITATQPITNRHDVQTLARFRVDVLDAPFGQEIGEFSKQTRIVADLREFGYDLQEDGGSFFLAYQDEDNPGNWIEVPLTTHQSDGLISAEVSHFSDWTSGWRPDGWALQWAPPTTDLFTGNAAYQYPFSLPPGRNGLTPSLSLSYSSGGLRGAGTRDTRIGAVATGWQVTDISITRTGSKLHQPVNNTYDYPATFRLTINGQGGELKLADGVYYVDDMPAVRVYNYSGVLNSHSYWVVKTGDGLQYNLGYTAGSNSITTHQSKGPEANTPWKTPAIIKWHVDTITDAFGNQINYKYVNHQRTVGLNPLWLSVRTENKDLSEISYNFEGKISDANLPPTPNVHRLINDAAAPGTRIQFNYTDDGVFFENDNNNTVAVQRLASIDIYHGNQAIPIRRYQIDATTIQHDSVPEVDNLPTTNCYQLENHDGNWGGITVTRIVDSVQEMGWDVTANDGSGGWVGLPQTTFKYGLKHHFVWNNDTRCIYYRYLTAVENGYGGRTEFQYESDGRHASTGGQVNPDGSIDDWYLLSARQYYIKRMLQYDGINPLPTTTVYDYVGRCYDQDYSGCKQPETEAKYGLIAGHEIVKQTFEGFSGEILRRIETEFSRDVNGAFGRPEVQTTFEPDGSGGFTALAKTVTLYSTESLHGFASMFTYANEVRNYQYQGGNELSSKVTYAYNPAYQNVYQKDENGNTIEVSEQLGQITHISEWDSVTAIAPYRTTRRWYRANAKDGHWIIRQTSEGLYEGNSWNIIRAAWNYYDGLSYHGGELTQGALTRVRQLMPNEITCSDVPGGDGSGNGFVCDTALLTIDQQFSHDVYGNVTDQTTYPEYGYQTQDTLGATASEKNYTLRDVEPTGTGRSTSITYDNQYNLYPVRVTDPLAQQTDFEIYGFKNVNGVVASVAGFQVQTGLLKQVIAPNNNITTYEYDPFGRLYQVYEPGDTMDLNDTDKFDGDAAIRYRYWDNSWNNSGQIWLNPEGDTPFGISVHTRPNVYNSSSAYVIKQMTYHDGFGRPIQNQELSVEINGVSSRRTIVSTTTYNALGQTECATAPYDVADAQAVWPNNNYVTDSCASKAHSSTTYDALGRVRFVTAPDGGFTQHVYPINTNLGEMLQHHNIIDANQHRMKYSSNSLGQLTIVTENDGECGNYWGYTCDTGESTWGSYALTNYSYDTQGNLETVADAVGNLTTMSYDSFGRKTSMSDPDMGDWAYEYDAAGSLLRQEDANGNAICFYYDALNRLERKSEDSSPEDACPAYGSAPAAGAFHLASYSYFSSGNGLGQLQTVSWGPIPADNKDTFSYDSRGRMTKQTRLIDNRSYTMETLTFDALNRPLTVKYPNDEIITMSYDHEGANSLQAGGDLLVDNITYNQRGQMRRLERASGLDTIYSYAGATGNFRLSNITSTVTF